MKKASQFGWIVFCGALTLSLTACPKKQTVKNNTQSDEELAKLEGVESNELDIHGKEFIASESLKPIYFNYDSSDLSDQAREILAQNAKYLKKNKQLDLLVEGHTDERGTVGYNLALGQKRAQTVRKYYISLGLEPKHIGSLSYGKERPVCKESTDDCYNKNRRAESKVHVPAVGKNGKDE